jgi:hypothetical protein
MTPNRVFGSFIESVAGGQSGKEANPLQTELGKRGRDAPQRSEPVPKSLKNPCRQTL